MSEILRNLLWEPNLLEGRKPASDVKLRRPKDYTAYWLFAEGAGTTIRDLSGNGEYLEAISVNGGGWRSEGFFLDDNGNGSTNDILEGPFNTEIVGYHDFTIIIDCDAPDNNLVNQHEFCWLQNQIRFTITAKNDGYIDIVAINSSYYGTQIINTIPWVVGERIRLVYCHRYTVGESNLDSWAFKDGIKYNKTGGHTGYSETPHSATPVRFGRRNDWNNYYGWDGLVRSVGAQNRVLGDAEALELSYNPYRDLISTNPVQYITSIISPPSAGNPYYYYMNQQ